MKLMGIDEAGRGSIVGPLVMAGFMVEESEQPKLKELGVKDSKELTPKAREELYKKLVRIGDYAVIIIKPLEIDNRSNEGINLNRLELLKAVKLIKTLNPDKVIIDSPSPNEKKYKDELGTEINDERVKTVCENKADVNYPVVSAASIIAKVTRDREINKIERELGEEIGTGYPHDDRSLAFVRKAINQGKGITHVRKSWETFSRLKAESEQKRLSDF